MTSTVTFTSTCNRGRPFLWLFCVYALVAGSSLLWYPSFLLDFPLLSPIERLTGLKHMATPTTPEEQRYVSIFGIFATAIGMIYALEAGPYWRYGGKVFVQASIDGRLIFAMATVSICFFTSHGSSCLFLIGVWDAIFALFTQWVVGSRVALYGLPDDKHCLEGSEEQFGSLTPPSRTKGTNHQ